MARCFSRDTREIKIPLTSIKEKVRGRTTEKLEINHFFQLIQYFLFTFTDSLLRYQQFCGQIRFLFIIEKQFINKRALILRQGLKSNPQRLQLLLIKEPVHDVRLNTDYEVINVNTILNDFPSFV